MSSTFSHVVYFDKEYHGSWISRQKSNEIVKFFNNKEFKVLDAEKLKIWMMLVSGPDKSTANRVVVFSIDIVPDTIYSVLEPRKSVILKYLRMGGKVVWLGDVPFYLRGESSKKRGKLVEYGFGPLHQILGVVSKDDSTLRKVEITEQGASAGLVDSWIGVRPVRITSDLTPLAISKDYNGEDQAHAWEKWGFLRLFDISTNDDPSYKLTDRLEEIYQISICPLELILKKGLIKKDVFIVHGQDDTAVNEIEDIILSEGHNPKYLRDYVKGNETLIELLRKAKDCAYVVILLTPDDLGVKKNLVQQCLNDVDFNLGSVNVSTPERLIALDIYRKTIEKMENRARQNVILEYGFFKAIKKDEKIMVLLKKCEEYKWNLPSDISGGFYIDYNESLKEIENQIRKKLQVLNED